MKIFSEKDAEEFLRKKGFEVITSFFVKTERQLKEILNKLAFPIVMKVSGKKIIHKKRVGGIKLNILDENSAIKTFNELIKIENAEEVLIQSQIKGKEFLLGLKKTPEFEQVLSFGAGGSQVEEVGDVEFRAIPLDENEMINMIKETDVGKRLADFEIKFILKNLIKLQNLAKNNSNILELDINPLIVNKEQAIVVDARIAWEE